MLHPRSLHAILAPVRESYKLLPHSTLVDVLLPWRLLRLLLLLLLLPAQRRLAQWDG